MKVAWPLGFGLCRTCRYAHVHEHEDNSVITICSESNIAAGIVIRRPVTRCLDYVNRNLPDKYDMEKIAWTLRTDNSGKVRGFQPPPTETRKS